MIQLGRIGESAMARFSAQLRFPSTALDGSSDRGAAPVGHQAQVDQSGLQPPGGDPLMVSRKREALLE